ncbi:succinylglutamate desuccinylase/aspartoacylase family protein [Parapedobacter soli]|uniref:succinylglutamate desuccinylase/aspartoacylase family protein n=1 Tax=Parapedobacter soli TaxID=416955 RepID=UPI0021C93AD3|nr:M14 family metallopeptidase [Parapedobacter soli]
MKPIYEIESGEEGPHLLITAGVHGDEYEPMLAVDILAKRLPGQLKSGKVVLVPVVNSSAYERGTREGIDGLDLARSCPGRENGSPTEVAAALISKEIMRATHLIDLHTGGRAMEIFPLAGYMIHSTPDVLTAQRLMARAFNLPLVWGTDNSPKGRTLSVARDRGIPAIYVEYGGGDNVSQPVVSSYVNGCMRVMGALGMLVPSQADPSEIRYWIEDPRPNSGHLQSRMPAPCEGVFIPIVAVGAHVSKGQTWGTIVRVLTGDSVEIEADRDGFALFVRASARVKEGETLGGIISVEEYRIKG